MTFEELIESGRHAESLDDLGGLWDELLAVNGQTMEGYQANTAELENRIAELEAQQIQLMAENYKLMTALATEDAVEEDVVEEEESEEEETSDDADVDSINDYIEED